MSLPLRALRREPASGLQGPGPPVSVLTPSFNQRAWLGENLRSVAGQSYAHLEHIVMDGGSTDGSVEVLKRESPDAQSPHIYVRGADRVCLNRRTTGDP